MATFTAVLSALPQPHHGNLCLRQETRGILTALCARADAPSLPWPKPASSRGQRPTCLLRLLPSCYPVQAHSACCTTGPLTERCGVEARNLSLSGKLAGQENGRVMSQPSCWGSGCQVLLYNRKREEMRKQSRTKQPCNGLLEWQASGRGCINLFLPRWLSGKRICLPMQEIQESVLRARGREDPPGEGDGNPL